jgi:hypothetical protein
MTKDKDPDDKHDDDRGPDADRPGREPRWRLNVQGVPIESRKPEIVVREAITLAGFDPDAPWIIVLKTSGGPKKEVGLNDAIDLRLPGIEKIRLTPRQIDNGESVCQPRLAFALLPQDMTFLDRRGLRWETALDGPRRWLLIYDYPLPAGYSISAFTLAIEVPATYPAAQLDMFYCQPFLTRAAGGVIAQTEHVETIFGARYQRWSRHRPWDPARDTLATHLALVDESLLREVEP